MTAQINSREVTVRPWEIIYRIEEMAFRRRAIVDKLRALQQRPLATANSSIR